MIVKAANAEVRSRSMRSRPYSIRLPNAMEAKTPSKEQADVVKRILRHCGLGKEPPTRTPYEVASRGRRKQIHFWI